MRILVMGGTRFNGLHLVYELLKHGHEVTILNRGITEPPVPKIVTRLYADRKDPQQLGNALQNLEFDVVFDISAYVVEDVKYLTDIMVGRTGHYIFASSTVVYAENNILPITEDYPVDSGPNQSDYGKNKLICEDFLSKLYLRDHFPMTIARFSMVFGPHNNLINREQRMFVRLLRNRKILIPGRGTTLSQVGHVDDEARALRMMARNPNTFGEIYNVTGKDYFSDEGYVDACSEAIGITPDKLFIPANVMDNMPMEIRQTLIQRLAPYIHRWDHSTLFSMVKLKEHIGYEPEYTFKSAVEQTYRWFVDNDIENQRDYDFSDEDKIIDQIS